MRVRLLILAFIMCLQSQFAWAEEFTQDDINFGGIIYMCEMRAEKLNLPDEVAFWVEQREVHLSDALYAKSKRSIDAVKSSLEKVDSAIISQRCAEAKTIFLDPDTAEVVEPSPEIVKTQQAIAVLQDEFHDELQLSGYAPNDAAFILDHFVELSNFHGLDGLDEVAIESTYAYKLAIASLQNQRQALKKVSARNKRGKALLQSSDICIDLVSDKFFVEPEISSEQASSAAVRKLIFQGMKYHRRALGGGENLSHAKLDKSLNDSLKTLVSDAKAEGKKVPDVGGTKDILLKTMMLPLCMQNFLGVMKVSVLEPIEAAEKKVSREGVK